MLQKFLLIFCSLIWYIFLADKSEARNDFESETPQSFKNPGFSSASVAAQASYSEQHPPEPNYLIELMARSISDGLFNSDVLAPYSTFRDDNPHDLLFRVGSGFLERAGVYDPDLAEIAGAAVEKVGYVDSELFFDAVGYMVAKFLYGAKLLKNEHSVTYLTLRIVSATDLVACTEGVYDTESAMNSVSGGLYKIFESFGLVTPDYLSELFYFFADEVDELSKKKVQDYPYNDPEQ